MGAPWPRFTKRGAESAGKFSIRTILHCISSLGGGGSERQLCYLTDALSARGWKVHVSYLNAGPNLERLIRARAVLHRIHVNSNYGFAIFTTLLRTIHSVKPDIIQTWLPQMDIVGGLAALCTRTPFVLTERSCAQLYEPDWKTFLRRRVGRQASAIVANSEGGRAYWHSSGSRKFDAKVIPNIVPFDEITEPKQVNDKLTIPNGDKLIVYAGRYVEYKNVENLLRALRIVLARIPDATAVLFGEGPLRQRLDHAVHDYKLEGRVRIEKFNPNLWPWLKTSDVFVSVSKFEGHPNAVLEAIACECPVVVSDIAAHREILDCDSAYFVSGSSPASIADGILKALSERDLAKAKSRRHVQAISRFSWEPVVDSYIKEYVRVLEHRSQHALRSTCE